MYGQMPRSGFDTKDEEQQLLSNLTTDAATAGKDDLDEIGKISFMLNPNEEVFVIARQSRLKPAVLNLLLMLFLLLIEE
jgi:hypothetical protein